MRDANWDEIFRRRSDDDAPQRNDLKLLLPWEDWLTLAISAIIFLSVVQSIDSAGWVDEMPSLYPIAILALLAGYGLSKIKLHEGFLHPVALFAGAVAVFLQLMAIIPGASFYVRTDGLLDRMYEWWSAVTLGGISTDPLPFIVLLLSLTWIGAFLSSWAIFRWRNAWIGLIPSGTALMWNISFIPGQFHASFVFFLFGAVLLVMRMHLARKEAEWDGNGVQYPEFMSLSVLNATFWVAVGLLIVVWMIPLAHRSETASERWRDFTSPYTSRLTPLARVFISVDAKKPIDVHNLKGTLPLQGKIKLSDREAVEIDVELTPEMAAFLRSQAFAEYTPNGWKRKISGDTDLLAGERTSAAAEDEIGARQSITVNVKVVGNDDKFLFSLGQPLSVDRDASQQVGTSPTDIVSVQPEDGLRDGDVYALTGSVNVASIEQLRAAGTDYPAWVEETYLQLPDRLPARVRDKAEEVTRNADTPYDKAAAVERYVRTFPNDFRVPAAPPGRDSVDYFLFDAQRGYFDYHASAMAVMLRAVGVPSRVAVGYAIDPLRRETGTNLYRLREKESFAWPEVYFPSIGWVEFSPTPTQPLIARRGVAPEAAPGPGAEPGRGLAEEGPLDLGINPAIPEIDPEESGEGGGGPWLPLLVLAGIGVVLAFLLGAGRFAWEYGLAGLPRSEQLWEKTARLASLARIGPQPADTPREFAARLRGEVPGTRDMGYLAAAYERSRFGQKDLTEDETERLESAWLAVRNRLLRRILRRGRQ